MRRWVLLGAGVVAVSLLVVLFKGFGRDPHAVPFMLEGKPAPQFELAPWDGGKKISLASLKGKPVVINFWATWCGPCKMEHPVIEWGARQFGRDAVFLGVAHEDTEENVRKYLAQAGSGFPQLNDPQSAMAVDYGLAGVPETYFIDKNGIIRGKHIGPIDTESLAERIRSLQE